VTALASLHLKLLSAWTGGIIILFFTLFVFSGYSQKSPLTIVPVTNCPRSEKQADIWYFGEHAGIEFQGGSATPLTDQNVMVSLKSGAVISDSSGQLLFFTDSKNVWDRTFNKLPYSPSLEGDQGSNQSCLIIPQPGVPNLYYIFTTDVIIYSKVTTYITNGLEYSIVDMKSNGGLGDGTLKWNLPLLTPACQKLTAVYHQNGRDVWIIAHKWLTNEFYAYLLDSKGISNPVISNTGSVHGGDSLGQNNALGYMKASPDGSKIALAISKDKLVELFNFNNSSGVITNPQSFQFNLPGVSPSGIEFSQDSRKVYTTLVQIDGSGPPNFLSRIYQFDLANGWTNPALIDSAAGVRLLGLQLATDGKIYVARTINLQPVNRKDSLDVIYNPTRPGLDCNYNLLGNVPKSRFSLNGRKSTYGLPNFLQSYFERPIFTHDSVCHGDVTRFDITNKSNIDSVFWNFGDGTSSTDFGPSHAYAQPGNYKVRLRESFNGKQFLDSATITIYPKPVISLGDTILVYSGSSVKLHAGGGFIDYQWSTGATDSIITVDNGGNYSVRVQDIHCCYNTDTVFVNVFKFYVPTGFAPDGVNKIFKPISIYKNVSFMLNIFDRWGQLVFQSNDIDKGWDGTMGGQKCMPEVYAWVIYVSFLGNDIITNGKIVLKGTVTLVR
jgi:gliding motility-associated-like protein